MSTPNLPVRAAGVTDRVEVAALPIRRLILPLDGTPLAEHAIEPTINLARAFSAGVMLVRTYGASTSPRTTPTGKARAAGASAHLYIASLYLARVEETLRSRGVRVFSRLLQWPAELGIVDGGTHGPAALIVMATRATGERARPSERSVTADMLEAATIPVLLFGPKTQNPFNHAEVGLDVFLDGADNDPQGMPLALAGTLAGAYSGRLTQHVGKGASPDIRPRTSPIERSLLIATASKPQRAIALRVEREDSASVLSASAVVRQHPDVVVLAGGTTRPQRDERIEHTLELLRVGTMPVAFVPEHVLPSPSR